MRKRQALWKCPACGHRFVTRHVWHSCVRVRLADHFAGKAPSLRPLFQRLRTMVRACGPATCYAQRSHIVLQARVRFASVVVRHQWLELALWLHRRVTHPRLIRVESFGGLGWGHHFRLRELGDFDSALAELIAEAYAAARQRPQARRAGA